MAVTYVGSGTFTAGTAAITPPFPAGIAANDIALLVCESENQAISLSTPNGFVELGDQANKAAGTAATNPASRLAVFWKRLTGADAAPTVADSGDHTTGQIHVFRGVRTTGNPWDVFAEGNDGGVNDTSGSIPGATTTVPNCLIVLLCSTSFNGTSTAQFSGWTNADLANLTERTDNSNTAGLGGGHGMATGEQAAAGAYGATTVTLANTSFKGTMSIALAPEPVSTLTPSVVTAAWSARAPQLVSSSAPVLVQHVSTPNTDNLVGVGGTPNFFVSLPHLTQAGNCLIVAVQTVAGATITVSDDKGSTYVAGPAITDTANGQMAALFYALNIPAGVSKITIAFSGTLGSFVSAVVSEFANIATTAAADGQAASISTASGTTWDTGNITTTAPGLIYYAAFEDGGFAVTSFTPGAGFTLLSADVQDRMVAQYAVKLAAGTINPSVVTDSSGGRICLAIALKSAVAGSVPSGIGIRRVQWYGQASAPTSRTIQFPCQGNLLVANVANVDGNSLTSITDSNGNTWVKGPSAANTLAGRVEIWYAANAVTSPTMTVTFNRPGVSDTSILLYDIANALAAPFDASNTAIGTAATATFDTVTLTPTAAPGIIICAEDQNAGTITGVVGAGFRFTSPYWQGQDGGYTHFTLDRGTADFPYTDTTARTFTFTDVRAPAEWTAVAASFKGQAGTTNVTVTPTAVTAAWSVLAPTVVRGGVTKTPTAVPAAWSVLSPSVLRGPRTLTPAVTPATWTVLAATVVPGPRTLTPTVASAAWSVLAPTLLKGTVTLAPTAAQAAWTVLSPSVSGGQRLTPTVASAAWSLIAPTVLKGPVTLAPAAAAATWSVVAPNVVRGPRTLTPSVATAAWAMRDPTILRGPRTLTPLAAQATWSVRPPTVTGGPVTIRPLTIPASFLALSPTVTGGDQSGSKAPGSPWRQHPFGWWWTRI
jgi:hypothetical protein